MIRALRPLLLGLAVGIALAPAGADDAAYEVRAYIEPQGGEVQESQEIRLILEIAGSGETNLVPPRLDNLQNLRVVGGPSTRFNSVWSGGSFSSTSQLIYVLRPMGPGPAAVGPISVKVGGRTYETSPIRFNVAATRGGAPPPTLGRRAERGGGAAESDVFIRTQVEATDVWVSQAIPLTLALYVGANEAIPNNLGWASQPGLSSFWVEAVAVDAEAESYTATVDGHHYRVFPVDRRIIVPQTSGTIEIEPFAMQMAVPAGRSRDPFDFFRRMQTIVRKSQPLTLNVRPLPAKGRPPGFGGAVGTFQLKVALDRAETAVNDAVALTATITGEGMLRAVGPPALALPPDVKVFDPETDTRVETPRGRLVSTKTWKWILVPLATGEIRLPELRFDYFDPQTGQYRSAVGQIDPLVVRQSDQPADLPQARGDIVRQREDLAFIKPLRGPLVEASPRAHERTLFRLLLVAPAVWVPLLILFGRHRAHLERNRGIARSRKAGSRARRRLRAARRKLETADAGTFHEEVARALVDYVADRFDRAPAGLTYELADQLLASRELAPDLRRRFRACLETCDFARYVPAAGHEERRGDVLQEASALMDQLERAW